MSLVAAVLSAAALSSPGLANPHPCPEAPGFTCSTLSVPLDRTGQTEGRLRLNVEPVFAHLRIFDPLLGVQFVQQPLLPAQPLVDWSQA